MKHVYFFSKGQTDGDRGMQSLLGGKGANLAEMTRLGIRVPPGFTITTEVCRHHLIAHDLPDGVEQQVTDAIKRLQRLTQKEFGGADDPLLVSVRSGGAVSMPGMMDTILNLGLNDRTVDALARISGNECFAYDSYRRFLQMYSDVVLEVGHDSFEAILSDTKRQAGVETDNELDADALRSVVHRYKELIETESNAPFPEKPEDQLWGAIEAVFRSWRTPRAQAYRKTYRIPHDLGTAVNVQTMVYGNRGQDCGTGVAFTRNAADGEPKLFGEFLINAQGEDVVSGTRHPLSIEQMQEYLPEPYAQLLETAHSLETHYQEMQDLEFTVEKGTLYLLQTRTGKRTARAAVRIAVDMANEGLITREQAVMRVEPDRLEQVLHPMVDPSIDFTPLAVGNPASPGAASGRIVLTAKEAVEEATDGNPVILVRQETSPDDFEGMVAAVAIVTARGGKSSHAAVVARGMGTCCVVGTRELEIDEQAGEIRARGKIVKRGDWITVDGASGEIIEGQIPTVKPEPGEDFHTLMGWADGFRRLRVRTNADNPADSAAARKFGAEGIGLCRTEHMFFGEERIDAVREMILASDEAGRSAALAKLLPMQRSDFAGIFRAMDGLPVTIRLLDPPLHEFLPTEAEDASRLAAGLGRSVADIEGAVARLQESNPMLGHRGCRLGYSHPEITAMQARAIIEAALEVAAEGVEVLPEIMVPLVGHVDEFTNQRAIIDATAREVFAEQDREVDYLVGTMIELPRACLTAGDIADKAEFFSFGTNDLTQTTLGLSRDDAGNFLPLYVEAGVYERDPFQSIDTEGVGRLMRLAVSEGRERHPELKVGICGEHGGDPDSVVFCHGLGMDYVSCSPFRVPVARLAAAHAALEEARSAAEGAA